MSKYSYRTVKKLILGTLLAATIYAAQAITAEAASVNLAWNASAGPGVTGYKVHYGTVSHNYTVEIDAGNSTAASAANLTVGTSYYIAVAAYNASGVESPYSNEVVYVPAAPTPTPAPTSTPTPTRTPTPAPTSAPTPTPVQGPLSIAGNVSYCSDSASNPVSNVILTRTGTTGGSVTSDSFGNYQFPPLLLGIYTVTPTKTALVPGASGINTADVVAIRRQYLGVAPLQGCQLAAANVNGDSTVNTTDVLAVQKFFLGQTNAIANAGKFQFTPANRTYVSLLGSLPGQDYGTLVLGDVIAPFADRPETQTQSAATSGRVEVALPEVAIDQTVTTFTVQATATNVDVGDQLVGFQGDFTFDETVVSFQDDPIESAGLTENNWTVAANVLPGEGPIRTLRISAFSNDLIPLSGSGPLFNLKMVRGGDPSGASTTLNWVEANPFIFIDANLTPKAPEALGAGSIILE